MTYEKVKTYQPLIGTGRITMADVSRSVAACSELSMIRRRDLLSAINRVAGLLDRRPELLELDFIALRKTLEKISPAAHGLQPKTLQNIKSDFLAAIEVSGLAVQGRTIRRTLAPAWIAVWPLLHVKRHSVNLARLARYCSSHGIEPARVTDQTMADFITYLETSTLSGKIKRRRREVPKIWNEVCARVPGWPGKPLSVPDQRAKSRLVDLAALPKSFQDDLQDYISWCTVSDPFDPAARDRRLKPLSLVGLRRYVRKAVDAAIRSGIDASHLTSLACLVEIDTFRKILRTLDLAAKSEPNLEAHHLAQALKVMAREWVKVPPEHIEELKKLIRILPLIPPGLRPKNQELLRAFEDDRVLQRLIDLPPKLCKQAHRYKERPAKALLLAQLAVQIEFLLVAPLRLGNLARLNFAQHISWPSGPNGPAYLHVPMTETKTGRDFDGELPKGLSAMLRTYREKFVPAALGDQHDRIFITVKGTPKSQAMIQHQFARAVWRHVGIRMSVHQMRHVAGKLLLDALPGGHQIVSDLLGHSGLETARRNYTGMNTARAIRHHGKLIDELRSRRGRP